MTERAHDWLILRTSGANTLRLAQSLAEDGYEVWTPVDEDQAPMAACYVFARMQHLAELMDLTHSPSLSYLVWDPELRRMVARGHPYFRLLPDAIAGTPWAVVSDAQLAPIRAIEHKRKPRGIVKAIPVDAKVRLMEGGFAGLDGVVQSIRGKFATVSFAGFPVPVQIGCWLLTEMVDESAGVNVRGCLPEHAQAA